MNDDDLDFNYPVEVSTGDLVKAIRLAADGKDGYVANGWLTVVGTGTCRAYGKHRPVFSIYLKNVCGDTYVIYTNSITGESDSSSLTAYPVYEHNWELMWRSKSL